MILFRRKDCRVAAHPQLGATQVCWQAAQLMQHGEQQCILISCKTAVCTASFCSLAMIALGCDCISAEHLSHGYGPPTFPVPAFPVKKTFLPSLTKSRTSCCTGMCMLALGSTWQAVCRCQDQGAHQARRPPASGP